MSDAESLTSDEGELKNEELKGLSEDVPAVKDILEEYILSDDEEMHESASTPKAKRRKKKQATNRKKPAKAISHR